MTETRKPRLLFYFLHLLGVGHVYRAKRLIEGFAAQGIDVDVVYGGDPIGQTFDAVSTHYLPPIRAADAAYSHYLDAHGEPLDTAFLKQREMELLDHFATLDPDMILIEAFPFGRRMVHKELAALLLAAGQRTNPPLIVSSVRDILQERKKPGRVEETRDWIRDWFDHVLVHSDPDIITLDATYPLANEIASKLTYTGFVVPKISPAKDTQQFDIIATIGGGGFGACVMETALATARFFPDERWCLATGPNLSSDIVQKLHRDAPQNVTIVERLNDLTAHLKQAKISVSQCGYNTAMDVLSAHGQSQCRAVFIPYDTQGQSEQLRRAELLEAAGFAINLPESRLTTDTLSTAINQALKLKRSAHEVNIDGVSNTAKIVNSWLHDRHLK